MRLAVGPDLEAELQWSGMEISTEDRSERCAADHESPLVMLEREAPSATVLVVREQPGIETLAPVGDIEVDLPDVDVVGAQAWRRT